MPQRLSYPFTLPWEVLEERIKKFMERQKERNLGALWVSDQTQKLLIGHSYPRSTEDARRTTGIVVVTEENKVCVRATAPDGTRFYKEVGL